MDPILRIALYQPDIPQNAGAILRLAACLDLAVDVIEPCGFVWDDARLRRAGMDYLDTAALTRHTSWDAYMNTPLAGRRLLFTTSADHSYLDIDYRAGDTLLFGRESAGVPEAVHAVADERLLIPMRPGARSLNVAMAAAIAASEAVRQLRHFAPLSRRTVR